MVLKFKLEIQPCFSEILVQLFCDLIKNETKPICSAEYEQRLNKSYTFWLFHLISFIMLILMKTHFYERSRQENSAPKK